MKLSLNVLADIVVLLHFFFVLFVIFGGLLVMKWKWLIWGHLPAACWGALVEFAGWICPLTPLEKWLRNAGGDQGYQASFIEHYIVPVLYPAGLTRDIQIVLGILVIVFNAVIYALVYYQRKHSLKP